MSVVSCSAQQLFLINYLYRVLIQLKHNQPFMAKIHNNNLNLLIYFLLFSNQFPIYLFQKPTQDSLISCLNNHKLTNYSTQSSSNFHHLHRFSLQNLRAKRFPHPYAIILPETKEQLISTILCCRKSSLEIQIRGGGHSYEGISSMPRGSNPFVIIDMMNLNRVIVNVESETAWVEGGATLGELYTAIAEKGSGYGFPAGVGPTVGVSGHFSGGGIGVMSRKYGLSADNVVDIGLIDAEGRDLGRAEMGEDVFWAVRGGGGGNFGIVYKWKVQLVKVPQRVTCFRVTKQGPNNHELAKLMYKWQFIAPKLEDDFYLAIYLTNGANKEVYVTFLGFYLGSKTEAMSVKNREFPELAIEEEEYREMSWIESVLYFSNLPNESTIHDLKSRYFVGKSCIKTKSDYVRDYVSVKGLEGMLDMVALEPNGLVILDPYGGIMDRIEIDAIPFPHRKGNLYNILYVAFWREEDGEDRYLSWVRRFYEYMTPFVTATPRGAYVNYVDLDLGTVDAIEDGNIVEKAKSWGEKYFISNYDRLVKAKTIIDPHNVFNHIQGIYPANVQYHDEL
ncbi:berberine bridge enzyme-like D-2 [Silene latifolia]|uniref:berberine bridge enzyme-like D-2 n=1 Tax=Silene latifolia TaxID=37657 RepID=UPI003D77E282